MSLQRIDGASYVIEQSMYITLFSHVNVRVRRCGGTEFACDLLMNVELTNRRTVEYWAQECESLGEDHLVTSWAHAEAEAQKAIGQVLINRKRERDNIRFGERGKRSVYPLGSTKNSRSIQMNLFWKLAVMLVISVLIMAFNG